MSVGAYPLAAAGLKLNGRPIRSELGYGETAHAALPFVTRRGSERGF